MKVLIACEFSGIVRDAFIARGHDAISLDLLPSERPGPHVQGDVFDYLNSIDPRSLDLFIFHWPCTYLTLSGVRWLFGGKGTVIEPERWKLMQHDAQAFKRLVDVPAKRVCGENPIPHSHARYYMGKYSQIIQPWQFGHAEKKATCFWLRNLPPLQETFICDRNSLVARVHLASPGPDRWKERSRTLQGIADAMADQWGSLA